MNIKFQRIIVLANPASMEEHVTLGLVASLAHALQVTWDPNVELVS